MRETVAGAVCPGRAVPALPATAVAESRALPPGTIVHPAWPTTTRLAEPGEEEHFRD